MKFKYSLFILLVIIFGKVGSLLAMEAEKPQGRKLSIKEISALRSRPRVNSVGAIPVVAKTDPDKGKWNSISLLQGAMPTLPQPETNSPVNRFSEKSEKQRRGSIWDESDEDFGLALDTFDEGLSNFRNQEESLPRVIAIEYDMETINTDEAFQGLLKDISVNMPSAKIDQDQKKIGLIMLYLNEGIELSQACELLKINGINAVKNSTEYTKNRQELILLVNKNLPYINKEALINFFVEEGNLTLDQILEKLEQNQHDIEEIYNRVMIKLKNQMVKDLVLKTVEKAIEEAIPKREINQPLKPKPVVDISEFDDSDIEDWG